jgi:ABC-type antimicrobial peptide transport system permease subunit
MALGAQRGEVTRMFVRYGLGLAGIGIACGLAAAITLTRLMGSLLFEVSPIDPFTYVAVCASLVSAAVLASYIPCASRHPRQSSDRPSRGVVEQA